MPLPSPVTPIRFRRSAAAVLGGALALSAGLAAGPTAHPRAATGTVVTLKVKSAVVGVGARHRAHFCGKTKRVLVFPRGTKLKYKGTVSPIPPKHFPVDVKVERCSGRHFRRLTTLHIQGGRGTGRYKAIVRAPTPSRRTRVTYYSAVSVVGGVKSNKRYFGIHR